MASLNTMRTKFGVILSILIGGALLAFVLSLKTEMGFSNNDPKVGEINGDKITYSEFSNKYEEIKSQIGEAYDDQQAARIMSATWQSLLSDHVFIPGLEELGLEVTDEERTAMLMGTRKSAVFSSVFADPKTGEYNVEAVTEFLQRVQSDPRAQAAWQTINTQAVLDRNMNKYADLVKVGAYVSKLEVENSLAVSGKTFKGRYVVAKYSTIPDSVIVITKSDKKAYYDAHKKTYRQTPYRTISYVQFEVEPTEEDKAAIEAEAKKVAEEFSATADVKNYARDNRHVSIAQAYVPESQLSTDEAKLIAAGKFYGPSLVNNEWKASRCVDKRMVPDSMTLQHIVLNYTEDAKADSLLKVAKSGADFAELAKNYSLAETAAAGGEIGTVAYASLSPEFAGALKDAKKNDVVKIVYGNSIQLMKVKRTGVTKAHYQVATMTYPIEASQATKRTIHNTASVFAVNAKGSVEKFNDTARNEALNPRTVNIEQSDRNVRGMDDNSIEIVRWANDAKVGQVSDIFSVGNNYYVAVLTAVNKEEYKSLAEVEPQIGSALIRDKKFALLCEKLNGETIEQVAEAAGTTVENFEDVKYDGYYIRNIGVEPRLTGTIASLEVNKVSKPVQGMNGAYVVVVDEVAQPEEAQTAEAETVKLQSQAADMSSRRALYAVQDMANVKDYSVKYF